MCQNQILTQIICRKRFAENPVLILIKQEPFALLLKIKNSFTVPCGKVLDTTIKSRKVKKKTFFPRPKIYFRLLKHFQLFVHAVVNHFHFSCSINIVDASFLISSFEVNVFLIFLSNKNRIFNSLVCEDWERDSTCLSFFLKTYFLSASEKCNLWKILDFLERNWYGNFCGIFSRRH